MALRSCFYLFRQFRPITATSSIQSVGYKSQYNVEYLHPKSDLDFISRPVHKSSEGSDEFSGYIPADKLDIRYSRSGGPGGQNVNKVNTKVEVRFHVASAEWLSTRIKEALLDKEYNHITNDGYLVVRSEKTRKQLLNQADCMEKIRVMVRGAAKLPYTPSPEELQLKAQRQENARKHMLRAKRQHSLKKQNRQKP